MGCSSGPHVPDAFRHGLPHARVLVDKVDCDPSPDTCTRYVVLLPVGTTTASLLSAVTTHAVDVLHWKPTSAPEVVESDEGQGYDGPGNTGGFINLASTESRYWARSGYTLGTPANPVVEHVQGLMHSHPNAVVVLIDSG
jgi:hypothetical protein